ncbi:MAG: type IV secretory system conjugative DNA transfer family protein [bacterium]|nr:type IV secretory system conjugative DNA transfer family protein [bacterium]
MQKINQTAFLEKEEFAKNLTKLNMSDEIYETGGVPLLVQGTDIYVDGSDNHTLIFGATGSKKSRLFAFPTIGILARTGESFVVTDPKGELYARTSADVKAHGYEVECLNLRDFSMGTGWNILGLLYKYYHNGRKSKAFDLLNGICIMLFADEIDERYWAHSATNVITGLFLYLFDHETVENCTMSAVVELWMDYINHRKNFIKKIKEEYQPTDLCYQKFSTLDNCSDKTVGSIESIVDTALNKLLINPDFLEYISRNELDMHELAREKSAIYLVIPDENHTYDFVVSLFIRQYYEVLIDNAQENEKNELPIRTNFIVDEFANLPVIDCMDSMITASRSRNIRFVLIVQALSQLQEKYQELTETIISNCANWIYLFSRETALLEMLQKLCGTVIYDNRTEVPLCSIFDLQHMDKEKGEALILSGRNYPCRSNLADIDAYPYPVGELQRSAPECTTKEAAINTVGETKAEEPVQPVKPMGPFKAPKSAEPEPLSEFGKELYDHLQEVKRNFFAGIPDIQEMPEEKEDNTKKLVADSFTFNVDRYEPGEWLEWLVAIGPEGMIMAEEKVPFSEIYNGTAILKMEQKMLEKYDIASFNLSYYWADEQYGEIYHSYLKKFPEKVYLTREELERIYPGDGFTEARVSRMGELGWKARSDRRYLVHIEAISDEPDINLPGMETNQVSQYLPDYAGTLGEDFMFRCLARKMNKMLRNTAYEDAKWYACRDADKDGYIAHKHGIRSFVRLTISSEAMVG